MTKYIVAARIDENGKAHGGAAGDQTGNEVKVQTLSSSGSWSRVLRPPKNAAAIVKQAYSVAANDNIGYDQYERRTLYEAAKAVGFDLSRVGKCECDCSSLVAVLAIAAGFNVSPDIYTGNERAALTAAGFVEYFYSGVELVPGDVLWRSGHTGVFVGTSATYSQPASAPAASVKPATNTGTTRPLLDVDGEVGPATVRALQTALGTPVDGIVSNQRTAYKKHWPACLSSVWKCSARGGSPMVEALQRVCRCEVDGIAGPATCRALQARLGVSIDGVFGPNSAKALQRRLNAGVGI